MITMRIPPPSRLSALASLAVPRRTVRLRLALLYGGLFLVCGPGLVAITYVLVRHTGVTSTHTYGPVVARNRSSAGNAPLPRSPSLQGLQRQDLVRQHASDVRQLLVWSLVALGVMTVASILLGWLLAGRVLRPLRTMTATTRRISQENLHERLALQGPEDELKELSDTIDGLLARLEEAFEARRAHRSGLATGARAAVQATRRRTDRLSGRRRARALDRAGDRERPLRDPRASRPPTGRAAGRNRTPPKPQHHPGRLSRMRVLVVEDERGMADDIAEGLRDQGSRSMSPTTGSMPPPRSTCTPTT
jgi:HAMP domain-containing protein